MIKAVLFDFGGVLTERCWDSRVIAELAEKGLKEEGTKIPTDFADEFIKELHERFIHALSTGIEERMIDILRNFLEKKGINYHENALRKAIEYINIAPFCKFRNNVKATLEKLKKDGLKIGVISNTPTHFPKKLLEYYGLTRYIDTIIMSCDVGYRKPSKEIFMIALKRLNVKPQEAIFVGDTLEIDIKGAKRVGMISVLIKKGDPAMEQNREILSQLLGDPPEPDFVIEELTEIIDVIKKLNQ